MAEFIAQALKRIKELPVLTVAARLDPSQGMTDLLHPDSFVADTQVPLGNMLAQYDTRVGFLGRRIADMNIGGSFMPLSLKYMHATEQMSIVDANDQTNVHLVGPFDSEMPPFHSRKLGFATVDIAELPPIGASHFVSACVEDDAALLVAADGPVNVKVIMSFQREVTVDPNTAAIIPPGSPIFMQGARSMLIRPVLV